jgi:PTH1 family peptidyl-tRNA hydrolase
MNFLATILKRVDPSLLTHLIIGLGNPGREYHRSRHNIGFMVVDQLAERLGVAFSRMESKSLVTKADLNGRRVILAKPLTYMNLSGQAVKSLARFYKIPLDELLVVCDDIDLPFGTLRLRPNGGSAGQKGMQSIIDSLGTQEFPRLRLGINRPPGRKDAADYVLQDFTKDEVDYLPAILDRAVEAVLVFVQEGLTEAMNEFNAPEAGERE